MEWEELLTTWLQRNRRFQGSEIIRPERKDGMVAEAEHLCTGRLALLTNLHDLSDDQNAIQHLPLTLLSVSGVIAVMLSRRGALRLQSTSKPYR